jgi:hypothetical protein
MRSRHASTENQSISIDPTSNFWASVIDEEKAYFCRWADEGVEHVQSRLGKINDELCDDGGASMNQSGLKRSTTDLGVCKGPRYSTYLHNAVPHKLASNWLAYQPPPYSHSQHTIPANFYMLVRFFSKYST